MPAEKASRSDYLGCGVWAAGFLVLVIVSFGIGAVLRPDPPEENGAIGPDDITLTDVGAREAGYRLVGGRDEADDPCVILFRLRQEVTGQCGVTLTDESNPSEGRFGITFSELQDGTTAVFGPVPEGASSVVLELGDGSEPEVEAQRDDDADVTFFLFLTEEEVVGPATFLDADGDPVG